MGDCLRIARAYLSGTAAAVWCFFFVCLLTISTFDWWPPAIRDEIARNQGGILSRKSYMAMFAYFDACLLGVLLRDNIAHPWASVLPRYRQKHLLVAALIAVVFLAIPMFSMGFVGTSDVAQTSVAVIFLACLAAGLWTLHHPFLVVLAIPFLVFVSASAATFPALAAFLAGTTPAASAAVAFLSFLALWVLAWRLLALNEEMMEYAVARAWGNLLRGRGFQGQAKTIQDCLAAMPADQQAALRNADPQIGLLSNLKDVDDLSGYCKRSFWQHLQLWRLGTAPTRTSASVGFLMVITLIIIPVMVFIPRLVGAENPARNVVVIFAVQVMTNPFSVLLFWFLRLPRLGYESLRPRTRQEFVQELGLALVWDMIQHWLGGVLLLGIAAVLWAPELLHVQTILLFMLCTGAGQLCAYAMYAMMGTWLLKLGMAAGLACACCPFMVMIMWSLLIAEPSGAVANIAIASVLAVASVATIPLAYRRWCRADLD